MYKLGLTLPLILIDEFNIIHQNVYISSFSVNAWWVGRHLQLMFLPLFWIFCTIVDLNWWRLHIKNQNHDVDVAMPSLADLARLLLLTILMSTAWQHAVVCRHPKHTSCQKGNWCHEKVTLHCLWMLPYQKKTNILQTGTKHEINWYSGNCSRI